MLLFNWSFYRLETLRGVSRKQYTEKWQESCYSIKNSNFIQLPFYYQTVCLIPRRKSCNSRVDMQYKNTDINMY